MATRFCVDIAESKSPLCPTGPQELYQIITEKSLEAIKTKRTPRDFARFSFEIPLKPEENVAGKIYGRSFFPEESFGASSMPRSSMSSGFMRLFLTGGLADRTKVCASRGLHQTPNPVPTFQAGLASAIVNAKSFLVIILSVRGEAEIEKSIIGAASVIGQWDSAPALDRLV